MELFATSAPGRHKASLLEYPQMLHHSKAGHRQPLPKRTERLPVLLE